MTLAKLTSKGQITIPKYIREYLDLHTGDKIEFIIDTEGQVVITSKTIDVEDIFGMVKAKKSVSIEDMDKAIRAKMRKRHGKKDECN